MLVKNPESKLNQIIDIAEKLEGSKLENSVLEKIEKPLKVIASYLGVDDDCALFFCIIFVLQNQNFRCVNLHDIAEFIDYSFIHILEFRNCLNRLTEKNLLYVFEKNNLSEHAENNGYCVDGSVMNSVIEGTPVIQFEKEEESVESVLDGILHIQLFFANRKMSDVEYKRQIISYEKSHEKSEIIKNIVSLFPEDIETRLMMYFFCAKPVMGEDYFDDEDDSCGSFRNFKLFKVIPRGCQAKRHIMMRKEEDVLFTKKLVEKHFESKRGPFRGGVIMSYRLSVEGFKAVFGEGADKYIKPDQKLSELDKTLNAIKEFAYIYEDDNISCLDKSDKLYDTERKFENMEFFKKMIELISDDNNRYFIFDCISDHLQGAGSNLCATLHDIYGKNDIYFEKLRGFLDEKDILLEEGFVEIEKDEVVENTIVTLGNRTLELLYGKNADIYMHRNNRNILEPEKLKEKKLFYSDDVQKQIDLLAKSLEQKNLEAMQKRLEFKGLSKGIAVLLYGAPGTGKTETVYQLAKMTDREIFHVDIADSKSMWFGESEKLIKKIFVSYRNLCKECARSRKNTPILLFNEADALISKRKSIDSGNVAQTENAIQNILLEEMEKLDGIMIATTNLCENMDKAFERRFLFKIKYEKPTLEARKNIWKSKAEFLDDEAIDKLAEQFDFSGGEIDNIVRKCEMNEIITGKIPVYDEMLELCHNERLARDEDRHIGFGI